MVGEHETKELEEISVVQKRPYQSPVLVEWGDIRELTLGSLSGIDDYPDGGGTVPQ